MHLETAERLSRLVRDFPLDDEAEPAPVYHGMSRPPHSENRARNRARRSRAARRARARSSRRRWRASRRSTRKLDAFTDVTADARPRQGATRSTPRARGGETLGPLAGVPFAVKNLFDVAGLPTRAGSKINRERAPARARRDAGRAAGGGRRGPGRRAQHGRIRLRFHRRERARRPLAQSARSRRA